MPAGRAVVRICRGRPERWVPGWPAVGVASPAYLVRYSRIILLQQRVNLRNPGQPAVLLFCAAVVPPLPPSSDVSDDTTSREQPQRYYIKGAAATAYIKGEAATSAGARLKTLTISRYTLQSASSSPKRSSSSFAFLREVLRPVVTTCACAWACMQWR